MLIRCEGDLLRLPVRELCFRFALKMNAERTDPMFLKRTKHQVTLPQTRDPCITAKYLLFLGSVTLVILSLLVVLQPVCMRETKA